MSGTDIQPLSQHPEPDFSAIRKQALDAATVTTAQEPAPELDYVRKIALQEAEGREMRTLPWLGQLGLRAARGAADATIKTVDTVSRGWSKLAQWTEALADFDVGSVGGKFYTERGTYFDGHGMVQAATGKQNPDTLDLLEAAKVVDPKNTEEFRAWQRAKLGPDAEAAASIAGELLSYAIPGRFNPATIVGKGGAVAGEALAASVMAKPIRRMADKLVAAGKWTEEGLSEAVKSGKLIEEIGKRSGWVDKAMAGVPRYMGEYGAMFAQNYAATSAERPDLSEHIHLMSLMFPGIARLGKAVNQRLMDKITTDAQRDALLAFNEAAATGKASKIKFALSNPALMAKGGLSNAIQSAAEAAGFMATDKDNIALMIAAYNGDPEAMGKLKSAFYGTTLGILVPKLGLPLEQVPYWKSIRPELNSYQTLKEVEAQKKAQAAKDAADTAQAGQAAVESGNYRFMANPMDADLERMVNPLLRSGWNAHDVADINSDLPRVGLSLPGEHSVEVVSPSHGETILKPNRKTWDKMRPGEQPPLDEAGNIVLKGKEAQSFITDLGLHGAVQGARGSLRLGRLGYVDLGDGQWRDPDSGTVYKYGLDGNLYQRDPLKTAKWSAADQQFADLVNGDLHGALNAGVQSPALDRWAQFIDDKTRNAPEEDVDGALAVALNLAQHGGDTRQAREMRSVLEAIDPALLAQHMTPETSRSIAHSLLAIGAGTSNPEAAMMILDQLAGAAAQRAAYGTARGKPSGGGKNAVTQPGQIDPLGVEHPTGEVQPGLPDQANAGYGSAMPSPAGNKMATTPPELGGGAEPVAPAPENAGYGSAMPSTPTGRPSKVEPVAGMGDQPALPERGPDQSNAGYGSGSKVKRGQDTAYSGEGALWLQALRDVGGVVKALPEELRRSWEQNVSLPEKARILSKLAKENQVELADIHASPASRQVRDESGHVLSIPTEHMKDVAETGKRSTKGAFLSIFEQKPRAMGKIGGEVGREVEQRAVNTIEFLKDQIGRIKRDYHAFGRAATPVRPQNRATVDWLSGNIETPGGNYETRFKALVEGRPVDGEVPAAAQELVDAYKRDRYRTGQWAEEAGTIRQKRDGTGYERFTAKENANIYVRTALSDEFRDLVRNPSDPRWADIVERIQAEPANKDFNVEAWKNAISEEPGLFEGKGAQRKAAVEVLRQLPFLPTEVPLKGGGSIKLLDGDPLTSYSSMVNTQMARNAVIKGFGQDIALKPEERAALGIDPTQRGPEAIYKDYLKAAGTDAPLAEKLFKQFIRNASGIAESTSGTLAGMVSPAMARTIGRFEGMRRSMKLMGSIPNDVMEALGSVPTMSGGLNLIKGMIRAGGSPREIAAQLDIAGAVQMHQVLDSLTDGRTRIEVASSAIASPKQFVQKYTSTNIVGAAAMVAVEGMKRGDWNGEWSRNRLRRMESFTEEQIQAMTRGEADESLYNRFVRQAVALGTSEQTMAERSMFAANRLTKQLFPFVQWSVNKGLMTARHIKFFVKDAAGFVSSPSKDSFTRFAESTTALVTYAAGNVASGVIGTLIGLTVKEIVKDWFNGKVGVDGMQRAYEQMAREWNYDKWGFLWRRGLANSIGGGPAAMGLGLLYDPTRNPYEKVASLTSVGSLLADAAAVTGGYGAYEGQSKARAVLTWLSRQAGGQRFIAGAGALLGYQNANYKVAMTALNDWKVAEGKPFSPPSIPEEEDRAFLSAARFLKEAIDHHADGDIRSIVNSPEFQQARQEILKVGDGKDVRASLRNRKALPVGDDAELAKIAKFVGDENMRALYHHDQVIEDIADAFADEKGASRHVRPELDQRIANAKEQVRLGNGGQVWRGIYQDAMESAAVKMRAGQPFYEDLHKIGMAMAQDPESASTVFSGVEALAIKKMGVERAMTVLPGLLVKHAQSHLAEQLQPKLPR